MSTRTGAPAFFVNMLVAEAGAEKWPFVVPG